MNELLGRYNNRYIKISLLDKEYSALLLNENNELVMHLLDGVDRENYLKLNKSFSVVNGTLDEKDITFFNLKCSSCSASSINKLFSLTFRIDNFIEGMKFTSNSNRKIETVCIDYYGIEKFSISSFYEYDENLNLILKMKYKEYNFLDYKLKIMIGNHSIHKNSSLVYNKKILFTFEYNNKQQLQNVIQDVWKLKCFLGLISKRVIGIKEIKINDNSTIFMNYTYFEDNDYKNEFLQNDYERFVLTFEDLENDFKSIYEKFSVLFLNVTPIFDIYLCMIEKDITKMNRFLNCNQIIEYISKEYDNSNAKQVWVKNGKHGKDITLSDRIESLIIQMNYIWCFENKQICDVSRKIANGRNYFIHHTQPLKKLENNELLCFSYFLEDLILAYLYSKIGVSKNTIEEKLHYNLYYDKKSIKV